MILELPYFAVKFNSKIKEIVPEYNFNLFYTFIWKSIICLANKDCKEGFSPSDIIFNDKDIYDSKLDIVQDYILDNIWELISVLENEVLYFIPLGEDGYDIYKILNDRIKVILLGNSLIIDNITERE